MLVAQCQGLSPALFDASGLAPAARSASTPSFQPSKAAEWSGVLPAASTSFGLAPEARATRRAVEGVLRGRGGRKQGGERGENGRVFFYPRQFSPFFFLVRRAEEAPLSRSDLPLSLSLSLFPLRSLVSSSNGLKSDNKSPFMSLLQAAR
jgi:hypothetical protein